VEKLISITYPEFVFVALVIQHAMRLRHIVMWSAQLYNIFFTLSHKPHDFRKKKESYWTLDACFDFLYNVYLKHVSL